MDDDLTLLRGKRKTVLPRPIALLEEIGKKTVVARRSCTNIFRMSLGKESGAFAADSRRYRDGK